MKHGEIHRTCEKYNIENYTINDDGSIDVSGDVFLYNKGLNKLPLKFNKVSGYFDCSNNKLTSLKGAPVELGKDFYCYSNNLTSLKGAPLEVGGGFWCSLNKLTSLKYSPLKVGSDFICNQNSVNLDYESYVKKVKRMNKLKGL